MAAEPTNPFRSLEELQEAHSRLQDAHPDYTAESAAPIQEFVGRARATGARLARREERQRAQRVIDYWLAVLNQLGVRLTGTALAPWDRTPTGTLSEADFPYALDQAFRADAGGEPIGWTLLLDRCLRVLRHGPLLAIVGPRRSGRSFLLRSGLVPALQSPGAVGQSGPGPWQCLPTFVPSESSFAHLTRLIRRAPPSAPAVVVPIDSFENLYTSCPPAEVDRVLELLMGWLHRGNGRHRVALTVRSDTMAFLEGAPAGSPRARFLDLVKQGTVSVHFDTKELRQIIEIPARRVGLEFQDAQLVDQVLRDVQGDPGALQLLLFTLRRLWQHREGNLITWQSYLRAGSGRTAVAQAAEECLAQAPKDGDTARDVFLQLVRAKASREITTVSPTLGTLFLATGDHESVRRVIQAFEGPGLLAEDDAPGVPRPEVSPTGPAWRAWLQRGLLRTGQRVGAWYVEEPAPGMPWYLHLGEPGPAGALLQRALLGLVRRAGAKVRVSPGAPGRRLRLAQESLLGYWPRLEGWIQEERSHLRRRRERLKQWSIVGAAAVVVGLLALWLFQSLRTEDRSREALAEHVYEAEGVRKLEQGELLTARHYFAAADKIREGLWFGGGPNKVNASRLRLLGQQTPPVVDWLPLEFEVTCVEVTAAGDLLAAGRPDGRVDIYRVSDEPARLLEVPSSGGDKRVTRLAFSRDGKFLAAIDEGHIQVQSIGATGGAWREAAAEGKLSLVALSDDGRFLAAVMDRPPDEPGPDRESPRHTIAVWQRKPGDALSYERVRAKTRYAEAPVLGLAFQPGKGEPVLFHSDEAGHVHRELVEVSCKKTRDDLRDQFGDPGKSPATMFEFSADGQRLAVVMRDASVELHANPEAATSRNTEKRFSHPLITALTFGRHGDALYVGDELGNLLAFQYARKELLPVPRHGARHAAKINALAVSPDGRLVASGSRDQSVRVWDPSSGAAASPALPHRGSVERVWFSADGRYLFTLNGVPREAADASKGGGVGHKEVRKWDFSGPMTGSHHPPHDGIVTRVAVCPNGRYIASADNLGEVLLWDSAGRKSRRLGDLPLPRATDSVEYLTFSGDGRFLFALPAGAGPARGRRWQVTDHDAAGEVEVPGGSGPCTAFAVAGDGERWAFGFSDGDVQVVSADGTPRRTLAAGAQKGWPVRVLAFGPEGALAAAYDEARAVAGSGTNTLVRVWHPGSGQAPREHRGHREGVLCLAFHPLRPRCLTGGKDDKVFLWDYQDGDPREVGSHRTDVLSVCFDPTGTRFVSTSIEQEAIVWEEGRDPATTASTPLGGRSRGAAGAAFSADGRHLVTFGLDEARLWHVPSYSLVSVLAGGLSTKSARFSADGKLLMAAFPGRPQAAGGCKVLSWFLDAGPAADVGSAALAMADPNRPDQQAGGLSLKFRLKALATKDMAESWGRRPAGGPPLGAGGWHALAAADAEAAGNVDAASFHLRKLADAGGDAVSTARLLRALLAHGSDSSAKARQDEADARLEKVSANAGNVLRLLDRHARATFRRAAASRLSVDWAAAERLHARLESKKDGRFDIDIRMAIILGHLGRPAAKDRFLRAAALDDRQALERLVRDVPGSTFQASPLLTVLEEGLKAALKAHRPDWSFIAQMTEARAGASPDDQASQYYAALAAAKAGTDRAPADIWKELKAEREPEAISARAWLLLLRSQGPQGVAGLPELLEQKCLASDRGDAPAEFYSVYGAALLRADRFDEAVKALGRASSADRPVGVHLLQGLAFAGLRRREDAAKHLQLARALRTGLERPDPAADPYGFWVQVEWDLLEAEAEAALARLESTSSAGPGVPRSTREGGPER